jgi:hypothetical protein
MESAGRERGKETRKRLAGGAKRQGNTKKILNRGNEPNKSFRINKRRKKRTQNELNFERKNAQITPKKRVLGGTFHVTGGLWRPDPLTRPVPSGESAGSGHPPRFLGSDGPIRSDQKSDSPKGARAVWITEGNRTRSDF